MSDRRSSLSVALMLTWLIMGWPRAADSAVVVGIRAAAGSSAELSWTAEAGHRYRVERAATVPGAWQITGELAAPVVAGVVRWTDTNAISGAPARFYRVADLGTSVPGLPSLDEAARASDLVPIELSDLYSRSARDTYDAIQFATSLAAPGSPPVTHGTLRLTGDAAQPVRYEPMPDDHLVLVPVQGPLVEVYVQELDLARNVYQWRQVSAGSDLVLRSEPGLPGTRATLMGRYASAAFPGVSFEVDLAAAISGYSEIDSSGTHTLSDLTVTGTLNAPGYAQTVQMRSRFELISVRGATGRLESASTSEQWNGNTVVFGSDTYVWQDAKRQRSFRDGKESNVDTYWNATGSIRRNGQPYGVYRKTLTPVGGVVIDLRFQVVLPDRVVDVEQWTIQAGSRS